MPDDFWLRLFFSIWAACGLPSSLFFGGLTAAKTKLLVFLAVEPVLDSLFPLVISASFSSVSVSRDKNEPFLLFPLCRKKPKITLRLYDGGRQNSVSICPSKEILTRICRGILALGDLKTFVVAGFCCCPCCRLVSLIRLLREFSLFSAFDAMLKN